MLNLAVVMGDLNKLKDAEYTLKECLETMRKFHPNDHRIIYASIINLTNNLKRQYKF